MYFIFTAAFQLEIPENPTLSRIRAPYRGTRWPRRGSGHDASRPTTQCCQQSCGCPRCGPIDNLHIELVLNPVVHSEVYRVGLHRDVDPRRPQPAARR
jgi:hypothetical protein